MISRKRDRSASPANSVDCGGERRSRSPASDAPKVLGPFIWSEVSMSLYACVLRYLHHTCGQVALEPSPALREDMFTAAGARVLRLCARETSAFAAPERTSLSLSLTRGVSSLLDRLSALARDASLSRGALCASLLRALAAAGLPEDDGLADESQLQAAVRRAAEAHAYSYCARAGFTLPAPPRYDGDRRAEAQHRQPRAGRVVRLPRRHAHAEVNAAVQLIEPKRRRPPLDENRIFLHPKKATASAVEDFLVDEELQHRALVVLARHMDAVGSLEALSPFARMLLWNTLGRDEALFDRLTSPRGGAGAATHSPAQPHEALAEVRRRIAQRRAAFDATRSAAREAALRIGWYAASAHWRDQVLRVVEDAEDADWCSLRDTAKSGTRAVFPNYAASAAVREFALRALRRVRDGRVDVGSAVEDTAACYDAVERVLLPLLEGRAPQTGDEARDMTVRSRVVGLFAREQEQHQQERLARVEAAARWAFDCAAFVPTRGTVAAFVTDIFVWPLQCLAALLELCAAARHSAEGIRKFSAAFVASNWGDEETLLEFLLRREPRNTPLATLVGLPRLVRDVFTSAQWLRNDKSFAAVVECRAQSAALPLEMQGFTCWRVLAAELFAADYGEELHALTVRDGQRTLEDGKLWTVAELQCTPRAWVGGLELMMSDC